MNNENYSINEIAKKLEAVDLEKRQKNAIFDVIDLKVALDMKEILFKMDFIHKDVNDKIANLEKNLEKRISLQSRTYYILFGFMLSLITALKLFA